jgi:glutamine cyclotransferase
MGDGMDRKAQLWIRLLGVLGFVLALLILPLVGRRCGMGAPVTPPPFPGTTTLTMQNGLVTATSTPGPTVPASTSSPLPAPTFSPLPTATPSPLPTATPSPLPTATPSPLPTATPSPLPTATSSPPPTPAALPTASPGPQGAARYTYRVLEAYPHDPQAFTQGLVYLDGFLYEGTGLRGRSSLRQVELETGEVLRLKTLPNTYFGEGIAILGEQIYQLTWQSHVGFIYDLDTFEQIDQFSYPTEGWGLTHDGVHLIMSDGTATLHYLDPADLSEVRQVTVRDAGQPVIRLNELEFIHGEVWANVWQTDRVARIDPQDGTVVGWIDLSGLLSPSDITAPVDVLNGIAYDAAGERVFITGKLWPKLYQIQVVPAD